MDVIKCFDVVSMVVEDATEKFKPLMRLNKERMDILKQYCDAIDSLSEEFDGESFEVEVDEITMEVTLALTCGEIIIEDSNHIFYELIKRSTRYIFSTSKDGELMVKFVFPSLWDKV